MSSAASGIPLEQRAQTLGVGWQQSADRMVTEDGDATGLHLLVADAKDGYQWRTAASLSEQGADTDQWIGQHCVTSSGRYAAVVYAPRTAVNHDETFHSGGLAAIVDLDSGSVRKLPFPVSLAYYNPGCGAHDDVAFTRNFSAADGKYVSELRTVDAATGHVTKTVDAPGQLTSAVPFRSGIAVATAAGIASVDGQGHTKLLAPAKDSPFRLGVDVDGGLGYEVRTDHIEVHRFDGTRDVTVASAALDSVQLHQVAGRMFIEGKAKAALPRNWRQVDVALGAELSSTGALAVTSADNHQQETGGGNDAARPISVQAKVIATGAQPTFAVAPQAMRPAEGVADSPALPGAAPAAKAPHATGDPATDTTDPNRACTIARNDPKIQALQPTPAMGEWAADLAVKNALMIQRPAGYNGSRLPAYKPQEMFPSRSLHGGGQVPAQILLGVMAQESNIWQASSRVTDGESGNFLIGGFYGKNVGIDSVDFAHVDCGYGAAQVTTGMSLKEGSSVYTPDQQLAIAVDYAANIAAGLQILQDKWNQLYDLGVKVNDGNPKYLENWWYALWAYNTGWHAPDGSGQYGLGWTNNMANEDFLADRPGFLDTDYGDAKHPGSWSYPERVLGWARHSLVRLNWKTGVYGPAYQTAHWEPPATGPARPGFGQFCSADIQCDMNQIHKPGQFPDDKGSHCLRDDLRCWWHVPSSWVGNCSSSCGTENVRYQPGAPEPSPEPTRLYGADCLTTGLPDGALVIDDVATDVGTLSGCATRPSNHGKLTFKFGADQNGGYVSKIDFHQIDSGFGGHMWTAHEWIPSTADAKHRIDGTWTLDQQLNGWARVLVYIPDHGAMTPQAVYRVGGTDSTSPQRTIVEGNYLDDNRRPAPGHWESLGAFNFVGTPNVTLSNITTGVLNEKPAWKDNEGARSVPWDAVAFQPIGVKPADQVVSMGDSYASGEGTSTSTVNGAYEFYRSSDHDGTNDHGDNAFFQDACHRSPYSWSRYMVLPHTGQSVGVRADRFDWTLNYHMTACSGATSENLLPLKAGQYHEGSQIDQGFLDQYTSLVTFSIGGNDARFTDVLKKCISGLQDLCQNVPLDGQTEPLKVYEPKLLDGPVFNGIAADLRAIHERAPNARILLMGYPKLMEEHGSCIPGIDEGEYPWLVDMGNHLDDVIQRAADQARAAGIQVTFADPRPAFAGHGACVFGALINSVIVPTTRSENDLSQQTLHPNRDGAQAYGQVATANLAG